MEQFVEKNPIKIDMVYSDAEHPENIFKTKIYRSESALWLHKSLASIVVLAAKLCYETSGLVFVLKDGLRTIEAQAAMQETEIVKANPHWCEDGPNRLLSPPGRGGHPRGMAIDVILETEDGQVVDMGTPFDYLTTDPNNNPSHRSYTDFSDEILKNRGILEYAMISAAQKIGHEIYPLPSEWWDFRFPQEVYDLYAPLSDEELEPEQRMVLS
jgi:D-alanyl-D-alanine dipeptidase